MISKKENESVYIVAVEKFLNGDYAACINDFLSLSEGGDARASLYAATILDRGGWGVSANWGMARKLYEQSLAQSYLPGAALGLALMIYKGRGGVQNFSEAARYFKMLRNNAFSQVMLGVMSMEGKGCLRSEVDALARFDKAWSLGHPLGLKNAAIIRFHNGQYMRAAYDFVRSFCLIFWIYGVKRLPPGQVSSRQRKKVGLNILNEESYCFHIFNVPCACSCVPHFFCLRIVAPKSARRMPLWWRHEIIRMFDVVWDVYDVLGWRCGIDDCRNMESIW